MNQELDPLREGLAKQAGLEGERYTVLALLYRCYRKNRKETKTERQEWERINWDSERERIAFLQGIHTGIWLAAELEKEIPDEGNRRKEAEG